MKFGWAALLALFCITGFGQNVWPEYVDGWLYLKLKKNAAAALPRNNTREMPPEAAGIHAALVKQFAITRVERPYVQAGDDALLPLVLRVRFDAASEVDALARELQALPGTEFVEKVPLLRTHVTPNDFSISSASVHLNQINAPNAWNLFSGPSNVRVAVVDNAVMWTHTDLVANTYTNTGETPGNGIDDDGNGYIDDVNGFNVADWDNNANPTQTGMSHGTHCAGIAAGRTDNGTGIASIGWNLRMIPVQAEPDASGSTTTVSYGYEGIIYAARAGADIISCSWGSSSSSLIEQAVINYAWNRGSIIIASAGNNGSSTPNYPAAYNFVYAVAGVDQNDVKIGFSQYGSWVDIVAPGWQIMSTLPYSGAPAYGQASGTSMSAPMVAGLAGIMWSKSPGMTQQDILNCISSTAVNIYTISGNTTYTSQLGAGRIDAFAAMQCAASFTALPPVANFTGFMRNTCPGTPVQFNDSSLYLPTAWSWTFQGGSPATSTLANPVVTWTAAGSYSVGLTASNANGNHTTTKLAYVNVAGPISLPFAEGFEQAAFLPAGWTAKNILNDSMYWQRVTGLGGFGTSSACAVFNNYLYSVEGERDEMLTPKYTFTNVAMARLRFDVAYARYDIDFSDTLEVRLSTNCGATWTSIYLKGGTTLATAPDETNLFIPTPSEWRRDSIDISSLTAGQNNVMFAFVNRGHYGQPIFLDNINLFFPTPTVSVAHATAICAGAPLSFTNTSLAAGAYTWQTTAGSPAISTASAPAITFTATGIQQVSVTVANGTAVVQQTRSVNVVPVPTLAANNPSTCSGTPVTLTVSGAGTYSWSTGGTASLITVTPATTTQYTVTGTNSNLCADQVTVSVTVQSNPTIVVSDVTVCPGGSTTLTASGASTYSWSTGVQSVSLALMPASNTVIAVTGTLAGCTASTTASITIGAPLPVTIAPASFSICPNQVVTFTATGGTSYQWSNMASGTTATVNPASTTMYSVLATAGSCTGAANATVFVDPLPALSVSVSPQGPYCSNQMLSLQAGGAQTYQWKGGPTGSVFNLVPAGPQTVTISVTGSNGGCTDSLSIPLNIGADSLAIPVSASSNSVCAGKSVTLTASGAQTYTWLGMGVQNQPLVAVPPMFHTYTVAGVTGNCPGTGIFSVMVHEAPASILSSTSNACGMTCRGRIDAQIIGGTGPYTYMVTGGNCPTLPCSNLCEGDYTVTTFDALGCSGVTTVNIPTGTQMSVSVTGGWTSCTPCPEGTVSVIATMGHAPYQYVWSNGVNGPVNASLTAGCYTVTVTDNSGCVTTSVACVNVLEATGEVQKIQPRLFPNPANETVSVQLPGNFTIRIYNALSQCVYDGQGSGSHGVAVAGLARGAYLVVIAQGNLLHHSKLLLE